MSNEYEDFVKEFDMEATRTCPSCQRKVADTAFATICVHCGWALRCLSCGAPMVRGRCAQLSRSPAVQAIRTFCGPTPSWHTGNHLRIAIRPSGEPSAEPPVKRLWSTPQAQELLQVVSLVPEGARLILDEVSPRIIGFGPDGKPKKDREEPQKTYAVLCLECRDEFPGMDVTPGAIEQAFGFFALHKENRHGKGGQLVH